MNVDEVLAQLADKGKESFRRTYQRHGINSPMYGVSTADLKAIAKSLKKNHPLAQQLWDTQNYDAQVLATMIADPQQMTESQVEAWGRAITNQSVADYFSDVVIRTANGETKAREWMNSDNEWLGRVGWHILARLAADPSRPDSDFAPLLPIIEAQIHTRLNRTRQAMLNALIAIGGRGRELLKTATTTAQRIGTVEIDHGDTHCVTPDPIPYMKKTAAHAEQKAAKAAGKHKK